MYKPENNKTRLQAERDRIEGLYTTHRIWELKLDPVRGSFDIAHLKEINRRIFQDLPSMGFDDVTPGQFRLPLSEGQDWMKKRQLSTIEGAFYVAYSSMDKAAQERLANVLESADPNQLRGLKTAEFTAKMGALYTELDYLHPFSDGNSRTLREFTKQLANESGYELDWDRFNQSETGRDVLYIARDLSVNTIAKPHIQNDQSLRKIIHSMDCLEGNRDLPHLLRDAIRPSREIAFEQLITPDREQVHEYDSTNKTVFNKSMVDENRHAISDIYREANEEYDDKFKVRSALVKEYGDPARIAEPDTEKGHYRGQIVVVTDKYVGQRLGANTFVLHDKKQLEGDYVKGKFVSIQYNNHKGLSVDITKSKDRKREHSINR